MDQVHADTSFEEGARPQRSAAATRLTALITLLLCTAVLSIAAALTPSARGYGTHQQLGGGPCGMILALHYPCPTCGMTTAFAHTVRGHLLQAAWAQPAGLVLALATIFGAAMSAWALFRGRWPRWVARGFPPFWVFTSLLVLLLAGWGFKVAAGVATGEFPAHEVTATGR